MEEKWKVGNHASTVVSDTKQQNKNFTSQPNYSRESKDDEIEYYGGYLVCESVANIETAKLISTIPELLKTLENLSNAISSGDIHLLSEWNFKAKVLIKKATEKEL